MRKNAFWFVSLFVKRLVFKRINRICFFLERGDWFFNMIHLCGLQTADRSEGWVSFKYQLHRRPPPYGVYLLPPPRPPRPPLLENRLLRPRPEPPLWARDSNSGGTFWPD